MNGRHVEFFGPDLSRGPFSSQRIETSALQIATALAQLRAPLSRSDDSLRDHADFIRELSDRLAPDWAAQIAIDVGSEIANTISTSIRAVVGTFSLLDCWLADSSGGGVTTTEPAAVSFPVGTVLQTIETNKHYLVITPANGVVQADVTYGGTRSWLWAVTRFGRVYYSGLVSFS